MHHHRNLEEIQKEWHGNVKSYLFGFFASLLITCISFLSVAKRLLPVHTLTLFIISLAVFQAFLQLHFFLHVGKEAKPKWESGFLYFTILILLIVVLGTLWIMFDLNQRVMSDMLMGNGAMGGHHHD